MTTTSPATTQTSQIAARTGPRHGAHLQSDPHGFGKAMSTTQGAETKTGRASRAGGNAGGAPDVENVAGKSVEARPARNVDEAGEGGEESTRPETDDSRGTMFALFPVLTAAELRNAEGQAGAASTRGNGEKPDLRLAERRNQQVAKPESVQDAVAINSDATKSGERMEDFVRRIDPLHDREMPRTAFARTLQANLGAMSAQNPASVGANDGEHKLNAKADAGTRKSLLASSVATIEQAASPEPRAERRDAMEQIAERSEKRAESAMRDAMTAEGRSPAGGDRTPLPHGPAAPLSTGNPVVQSVASTPAWASAIQQAAAVAHAMPGAGAPVEALKIQLHPAELGMVTANLRIAGGQLSIEIDVDTPEAYLKLSSERDAISKALRTSGMAVDNVTINPPPAHQPAAARDPGGAFASGQNLARQDFQGGGTFGQSGNSGNAPGDTPHHSRHDNERIAPNENRPGSSAPGNGVYI